MPITIYPGTVKKRNLNGTYSDLVPGADANPQLANDIAEEYDPVAGVYSVDDYCIYQSVLYKCITAISTPEAFDSTKWTDVSVTDEIGGVKNTLNNLDSDDIANASTNVSGATVTAAVDNLLLSVLSMENLAPKVEAQDYNELPAGLCYNTGVGANCPTANGYMLVLSLAAGEFGVRHQYAIDLYNHGTNVYYRNKVGSSWHQWKKLGDDASSTLSATAGTNVNDLVSNIAVYGKICVFSYYFKAGADLARNAVIANIQTSLTSITIFWNAKSSGTYRVKTYGNQIQADEAIPNGAICQGQIVFVFS